MIHLDEMRKSHTFVLSVERLILKNKLREHKMASHFIKGMKFLLDEYVTVYNNIKRGDHVINNLFFGSIFLFIITVISSIVIPLFLIDDVYELIKKKQ